MVTHALAIETIKARIARKLEGIDSLNEENSAFATRIARNNEEILLHAQEIDELENTVAALEALA